jgi:rubrerythrin
MQISYHQKKPVKNKHKRFHYYKKDGKWKPKIKFETHQEAEKYLKAKHILEEYNIYRCPYCGKFHIGHLYKKTKKESE